MALQFILETNVFSSALSYFSKSKITKTPIYDGGDGI